MRLAPERESLHHPVQLLVLDSHPGLAEALSLALKQRARVSSVTSARSALLVAARQRVDLVIARMIFLEGCLDQFLCLLRRVWPEARVALVGNCSPGEVCAEDKADVWFSDPIWLGALLTWIKSCIELPLAPGSERSSRIVNSSV